MAYQNINHTALHLDEDEAAKLARAVQMLVLELGFEKEQVECSYKKSLAYFLER
jgi:hypothetical protein